MSHWIALLLTVFANVGGNLALKKFSAYSPERMDGAGIVATLLQPWLWIGAAMAGIVSYIWALRGIPLSVAYPIGTGVSAAGVLLASALVLGESVGLAKMAGVLLITQ